jgi:hypothetical protein
VRAGGLVDHLPNKHEFLSSSPSIVKKKKERKKERKKESEKMHNHLETMGLGKCDVDAFFTGLEFWYPAAHVMSLSLTRNVKPT